MKKILFFDTETTGLPVTPFPDPSYVDGWPRLVQLAFIITDSEGKRLNHYCEVIKPMGFQIPPDMVHRISHEEAVRVGVSLTAALWAFQAATLACDAIVAHNFDFDFGVISAEAHRYVGANLFEGPRWYCTQKQSTSYVKIPRTPGSHGVGLYKWPSLAELHEWAGHGEIEDAHDALADTIACCKCFFALRRWHPDCFDETYMPQYD